MAESRATATDDRPSVLVVEDEFALRRLVTILLGDEGFAVAAAGNGAEALDAIASRGAPDIALVDLVMPVLDGRGFLEAAQRRGYKFPVLLVSASPEAEAVCAEFRCAGLVAKPYSLDQLVAAMRRALSSCVS